MSQRIPAETLRRPELIVRYGRATVPELAAEIVRLRNLIGEACTAQVLTPALVAEGAAIRDEGATQP
jgi:hypothetical protein